MFAARSFTRLPVGGYLRANVISSRGYSYGHRRLLSGSTKKDPVKDAVKAAEKEAPKPKDKGWWSSPELWGGLGAAAGWGMSGSAIYDSLRNGPELISMNMTSVLIVYSSLFTRWAMVVSPPNYALAACHATNVAAQLNQLKRALEYKLENGMKDEVEKYVATAAAGIAGGIACIVGAPRVRTKLMAANLGILTSVAAADAGPFTVHFWAPMSKWLISGASFLEFDRPTDKISISQYSALTLTGLFFSRYALLVVPLNPLLCAVNVALFGSSAWHLGRKINADYIEGNKE